MDAQADERSGLFHGRDEIFPSYRVARDDGCENIPGAVPGGAGGAGDGAGGLQGAAFGTALGDEVDEAVVIALGGTALQARHGYLVGAESVQLFADIHELLLAPSVVLVADAGEQARLGDVGRDDIGQPDELFDLFAVFGAHGAIGVPVISHDGIDEDQRASALPLLPDEIRHHGDLLLLPQQAHINSVKRETEPLPLAQIVWELPGKIMTIIGRESGVVGINSGGDRAGLHPHGAQNGDRFRGGAAPVPCEAVEHGNPGRNPVIHEGKSPFEWMAQTAL